VEHLEPVAARVRRLTLGRTLWLLVLLLALAFGGAFLFLRTTSSALPVATLSNDVKPNGTLLANAYSTWNPTTVNVRQMPGWFITNGSLYSRDRGVWTGQPDNDKPNALSTNGNGSATFRIYSNDANYQNVEARFDLENLGFVSGHGNPAHRWDGLHLFLRLRSEYSLYVISVNRRDHTVSIKRKSPTGPSNGGTYNYVSNVVPWDFTLGTWQHVVASAVTNTDGTVTLRLYINGEPLLNATDTGHGTGGAPITQGGRVGFRGDNDNFVIRNFSVWTAR